jgi:hypothetical protein
MKLAGEAIEFGGVSFGQRDIQIRIPIWGTEDAKSRKLKLEPGKGISDPHQGACATDAQNET